MSWRCDLRDPQTFRRVFAEHERGVYAAAFRILGDAAQAQDVVQDVFLRLWRRPGSFDPDRGELGSYLRLMARSRALDLWREGQAAGRAADRLKVVVGRRSRASRTSPPRVPSATRRARSARRLGSCPRPSARRSCSPTGAA